MRILTPVIRVNKFGTLTVTHIGIDCYDFPVITVSSDWNATLREFAFLTRR